MLSPEKYFEAVKKLENEMITVINSMKEKNTRNKVNSFLHVSYVQRCIHKEVPIEKWFHKIVNNPQNRIVWKELIIN